jgi:hypothetical protein
MLFRVSPVHYAGSQHGTPRRPHDGARHTASPGEVTEIDNWTGRADGDLVFDYLLAFRDQEHHAEAWRRVGQDEAWQSAKAALGEDVPSLAISSTLLTPTSYSSDVLQRGPQQS